jgi:hypothetical protein
MKKIKNILVAITLMLSTLTAVTTNANAYGLKGYSSPNLSGGYNFYGNDYGLKGYSSPNLSGGYNFYGNDYGLKGYSSPNLSGGYNFYKY